jgi:group II intron reverse transcriptase/maturase
MISDITRLPNLHSAFARAEASHGMAGVDGVTIKEFGLNLGLNLRLLASEIEEMRYRPLPLLKFLVAKRDGSPRSLTVPTVRDRVAQAAVLNVVEPLFERELEDASFAYRKGRSVRAAACCIRNLRDQGFCYVLECDVDSYFDSIDHDLLFSRVKELIRDDGILKLIRMWVEAEVYDGKSVFILERGIPQGSVISPSLANLFLDEFDEAMLAQGHKLVRYADDFVVLTKNRSQAEAALELTEDVLSQLQLELDEDDTHITEFSQGFKFLGLVFLKDSIFAPFDRPVKERRVLYMPPTFDLPGYLAGKRSWP